LDDFLGNPTEDPHGDQFECKDKFENRKQLLSELAENQKGICVGVKDTSSEFLKYLTNRKSLWVLKLRLLKRKVLIPLRIRVGIKEITVSNKIASNLYIKYVSICSRLFHKH
jgi:DtxR family Mn-dependent transcriptional regulator